ncbi:SusC/RagA family TonB-linked outer membrane protein [Sphingobacterium yanglingense]|uniref:TonB-linked SusC/RagA family outer membrane protein n=1 Tax=Sphingobacterium yanglingense TaxID=1437280 RepID=A0A4R6WBA0_9SPHI|nr:SusC/RagA family TonB-linked outer membrane protein [Sphingobacterium yanglingense]TDQ72253.1 TonB-linked SusC/RagA family outer membrane protein [Sphingobacterium yanglingense]
MKKYTKARPRELESTEPLATRRGQEWYSQGNLLGEIQKVYPAKGSWKTRLSVVLLSTALLQMPMPIQAQKITLNLKEASIKQIFQQMEKQSGYSFFYKDVDVAEFKRRGVSFNNTDLNQALESILAPYGLECEIVNKTVVIKRAAPVNTGAVYRTSQHQQQTGKVVDESRNPILGAVVTVKGGKAVVSTTSGGAFSIDAKEGDELIISHISYFSKTVKVGGGNLNIVLQANDNLIEQVVITGYTDYKKGKSASATASVQAKDIGGVPMGSLDQVLQGKVPGMSVVSSSGQPGQSAAVVIRGIGSIRGTTTPLYVMDGVPIEGNAFQAINPEDIENVNVLKDASAKALYGSRGSNGVVVITTKKGRKGGLNVNYSSQYGFSTLTRTAFEMMDSKERLRFEEEVGLETGRDIGPGWRLSPRKPNYNTQSAAWQKDAMQALDSLRIMDTDWRDLFFQDGRFMEQQLSLSGGNENVQTYNSLSLWNEDGIVKETGMNRYTLRSNTNMNYGRFTAGINLSLGYSNSRATYNEGGTGVGSPMASVYYALPYEYPYTADGVFYATDTDHPFYDTREGSRGVDVLYGTSDKTNQFKTILGLNMAYEIMPGLKVSTRAGVDFRNSELQGFVNPLSYIGQNQFGKKGSFGEGYNRNFNLVSTSGLTYNKTIDLHDFEVSGFFEYIQSNYKAFGYTGYGLDDRLPESPKAITVSPAFLPDLNGSRDATALLSYMGVGRYTYDNKYTVTGSYRYDGASLASVPSKNRWHGFYSFGSAWDAKQEDFLRDNEFIPVLRLRASYGQTASPLVSSFGHMSLFSVNTSYGGQQGIRPANLANPDSDWEYVNEFNTGFDIGLFRGQRLNLTVDYYNKITQNMFLDLQPSATAGMGAGVTIPLSSGRMGNKGIEFALNGDIIKNKDITWNVGVNGAYNQNKILRVSDVSDVLMDGDTRIIQVGLPYGTYYGPQWAGVNPENGDAQYYNRDGSITNVYDSDGQSVPLSASRFPKFTGGITTNFRWKDLTLSALLSFVSNVDRWNNIDFYIENQAYMTSNQSKRMLYDRWKKPGDVAVLQRVDVPRNFTSKDIQDASFMRLRNLQLNYSIPVSLFGKTIFKTANIFVQGQNLFTWTTWRGLDPENNRQYGRFEYPNARKYTAGINVNF